MSNRSVVKVGRSVTRKDMNESTISCGWEKSGLGREMGEDESGGMNPGWLAWVGGIVDEENRNSNTRMAPKNVACNSRSLRSMNNCTTRLYHNS